MLPTHLPLKTNPSYPYYRNTHLSKIACIDHAALLLCYLGLSGLFRNHLYTAQPTHVEPVPAVLPLYLECIPVVACSASNWDIYYMLSPSLGCEIPEEPSSNSREIKEASLEEVVYELKLGG